MKNQEQTKTTAFIWVNFKTRELFWTMGLAIASIIAPAILAHTPQNQWLTGTIVNAILFVSAWRLGLVNAFFIAVFPSTIALIRGLLPAPMAMLIPYIILSNIILIASFRFLKKNQLLGILLASFAKFLFLYLTVTILFSTINTQLIKMMELPQLITALAGGLIAIGIIKKLKTNK